MYTLYYAPGAASLAVHWMLIEIGAPFETVALDFEKKDQKRPDFLKLNPAGMVPTLVDNGEVFTEVAAILTWLAERHQKAGFSVAPDDPRRRLYLQHMFHLANTLQPAFRLWFYPDEGAGAENAEATQKFAREKIEAVWTRYDALFADARPFLLGDEMTAADFLLTMLARWSRNMPKPATKWLHLSAYIARMKNRAALREVHRREGLTDWISA